MWLTRIAIQRPAYMLMAIGMLILVGLFSWTKLNVDLFPSLDYPFVQVTTVYPGAGPEAVDTLVTKKIEEAISDLNEVKTVTSVSSEGVSSVGIEFTERAAKDAPQEVERRVNAIRDKLPTEAKVPTISKFDFSAEPVLTLALTGNRTLGQLQTLGEDVIKERLEKVSGVARVTLVGGLEREIQVQVDSQKLQARGLSLLQVNQALASDNLNAPAGNLTDAGRDYTVRLNNQAQTPQELADVMVSQTANGPVYLGDVATIQDTFKKVTVIQRSNGQPSVGLTIVKQSSANTIDVVDKAKVAIEELKQDLPADIRMEIINDASVFTRNNVHDVQRELTSAVILTGLVLLLFLHTFRATLIVLLAIPTSLIATLAVMKLMGFSLNMMSLMGLTLTVGILVDDSIVVLENIFRHFRMGEDPKAAAINGRNEIGLAAIAITLVDVVVFVPIGLMTGPTGQWFRQFGLVIATATLFSLFISFTLTPMLASKWYRKGEYGEAKPGSRNPLHVAARIWDAGYAQLERGYARVLRVALRVRWLTVGLGVASLAAGIMLVATGFLSSEFLAPADNGEISVKVEMPAGSSLETTDAVVRTLENRLGTWPEVDHIFTTVGLGGDSWQSAGQARFARLRLTLVPKHERTRSAQELLVAARTLGTDIPGAIVKSSIIGPVNGDEAPIRVRVQGEDAQILASLATQVAAKVRNVPGTANVSDGGATGQPELMVNIDRRRAADLGLTPGQVASVLRTGIAGSQIGTYRPEGTKGWDVTVLLDQAERARPEQVADLPIVTPRGATIKLGQVANITTVSGPTQVDRYNRKRSVAVTAYLDGRTSGDVARDIEAAIADVQVPAGYIVAQGGEAQDQGEAFAEIFTALGLSVVLMYLLMVVLFGSVLYPFIIMLSLPLAIAGAFGLLAATGNTLNIMSMIGLILLMGLVGKNAILLVDYTNHLRRRGVPRNEALLEAGPTRLRPILMTTSALILAMLPLAMRLGEGSEWRAPTAVTVIGGLLTSTLLTLILIPAVYTIMDDMQSGLIRAYRWISGRFSKSEPDDGEPEPAQEPAPRPAPRPRPAPVPVAGGSE